MTNFNSTIVAVSSPPGTGAIALIRLSGPSAFLTVNRFFKPFKNGLPEIRKATFGRLIIGDKLIDEVIVTYFKAPDSYSGEDMVEISCHGSPFIQREIVSGLLREGIRLANPGEFTLRSFLNGKMDLIQAEAVADLIHSSGKASHEQAIRQMKGEVSREIQHLRAQLLRLSALIELELDFSEEDVEFANRTDLNDILLIIKNKLKHLADSFKIGNALKSGIQVAIAGKPNVGKSTLLNVLLNEERAIVSEIPGTTRDSIEDTINIDGYLFRFIDTAGIRNSTEPIEKIGIERSLKRINDANIVFWVLDTGLEISRIQKEISEMPAKGELQDIILVFNKSETTDPAMYEELKKLISNYESVMISAKYHINIDKLKSSLLASIVKMGIGSADLVVTNLRHYEALIASLEAIVRVEDGLKLGLTTDLIAQDLRHALHFIGEVTGEITNNQILDFVFGNFCIGK